MTQSANNSRGFFSFLDILEVKLLSFIFGLAIGIGFVYNFILFNVLFNFDIFNFIDLNDLIFSWISNISLVLLLISLIYMQIYKYFFYDKFYLFFNSLITNIFYTIFKWLICLKYFKIIFLFLLVILSIFLIFYNKTENIYTLLITTVVLTIIFYYNNIKCYLKQEKTFKKIFSIFFLLLLTILLFKFHNYTVKIFNLENTNPLLIVVFLLIYFSIAYSLFDLNLKKIDLKAILGVYLLYCILAAFMAFFTYIQIKNNNTYNAVQINLTKNHLPDNTKDKYQFVARTSDVIVVLANNNRENEYDKSNEKYKNTIYHINNNNCVKQKALMFSNKKTVIEKIQVLIDKCKIKDNSYIQVFSNNDVSYVKFTDKNFPSKDDKNK